MNLPINIQTMSSIEIAQLTGKTHANVIRDIRKMLNELKIDLIKFESIYLDSYKREAVCYKLPKDETLCLVLGYDINARMAVIKRWQALENSSPVINLADASSLRNLLLGYTEKVIALEAKIEQDAPKVEFAMAIRKLDGTCEIAYVGSLLGYGRNTFFKMLRKDGLLMANNRPYQKYKDMGVFTEVEGDPYADSNGKTHPTFQTRVTGGGQAYLLKRYRPKDCEMAS